MMKLTIRNKLYFGFAMVLLLISAVNIYGLMQMDMLANLTSRIYNHPLQVSRAVLTAQVEMIKMHRSMKDALLVKGAGAEAALTVVDRHEGEVYRQLAIAQEGILEDEGQALVAGTIQTFEEWQPIRQEVITQLKAGRHDEAVAITLGKSAAHMALLEKKMAELSDYAQQNAIGMYESAQASKVTATTTTILGLVVALLTSGLFGWLLARSIAIPLAKVTQLAENIATIDLPGLVTRLSAMAAGDLTRTFQVQAAPLSVNNKDEIGQMAQAFNTMIARLTETGKAFNDATARLRELVARVAENATHVEVASNQLSAVADQAGQATAQVAKTIQDVARGTDHQTQGIVRTMTSVEQMTRTIDGVARGAQEQAVAVSKSAELTVQISTAIKHVTTNAQTGAQGAVNAAQTARGGAEIIAQTIQGMEAIKARVDLSTRKVREMGERSEQIETIVETIDDIASQTNLLALNAAIEAARAGEHGRGFAVVADEVRKLAEKSATATREIGDLIRGIQATVTEAVQAMAEGAAEAANGVERANESSRALGDILHAIELVTRQVEEISAGAEQMSASSTELVRAMETVSAVVEENTAATEEMAANSSEVIQTIEGIASASDENNAAVEEVSANAEEMNAQVEEVSASAQLLHAMALELQRLTAQFKIDHSSSKTHPESSPPSTPAVAVVSNNGRNHPHPEGLPDFRA